jgi:hypothetical protein
MALSLFFLVGCATVEPFPAKYVYELDTDNFVCVKYEIVNLENLTFKYVDTQNLLQCNGVFGFKSDDTGKVMSYTRRRIQEHLRLKYGNRINPSCGQ